MASNSREARRRKILERGSDRLAFITGQINNVPPPSPSSDPTSLSQSQSQSQFQSHLPTDDTLPPRDQIRTDRETGSLSLSPCILCSISVIVCVCVYLQLHLAYWVMMC